MKRQISICVFLLLFFVVLVFTFVKEETADNSKETETEYVSGNTEEESEGKTVMLEKKEDYLYVIINDHGRLSVYETDEMSLFLETAIETQLLPKDLQEDLTDGIYMKTTEDLYDFLESYSS